MIAAASMLSLELATPGDDAALRALLRRMPMGRRIKVTFEREPSYFSGVSIQGDFCQVMVGREEGKVVGMGTRAVGLGHLNGAPAPVGFLSDLRIEEAYRGGTRLARGYRFLRGLHGDGRCALYTTVIVSDNAAAVSTIAQGRAGLPNYRDLGLLLTPAVRLGRRLPELGGDFELVGGAERRLPELVDCLNRHGARRQFAPVHRVEDFRPGGRWLGLTAENFTLALRGGRIVGALARWDQSAFKQTRVAGYGAPLSWVRRLTRLPAPGRTLPFFYASFAAVDGDDLSVFRALLRRLYNDAVGKDYLYFIPGLHERDPLAAALRDYSATPFSGRLYCVSFVDGESALRSLDGRIPHAEAALL
ncbi:MAG: hypothetical protein HY077_03725 [Elusimicrobia bacterium]|nr:hypothetical protein [Elusimicrobiota bacterium]